MARRLMTERDHTLLLALHDIAAGLNDQIEAVCQAVADLVGMRPHDDAITDYILNEGDLDNFLKDAGLRVVRNGVEAKEEE